MEILFPTRKRSKRVRRQYRLPHGQVPIDREEHEDDDDDGRVFFHEKYGRVRSPYLANILEMVKMKDEEDDHRGAEKMKMSNEPVAAAMKPVAKEELGSGQFYGHGIELLQNLSLLADVSAPLLTDKAESSSRCNRGPAKIIVGEEEEGQAKIVVKKDDHKTRRNAYDGSSSSGGGPANKKKKANIFKKEMMQPLLLPAWMIDKFHQLGAACGDNLRVFSKKTEISDTEKQQGRLLLSKKIMEESGMLESLTEEEMAQVYKPDGLSVLMVDGEKVGGYNIFFKFLISAKSYRIIGKWSEFVTDSKLQPHLHTLHLCFFHSEADPSKLRLGVIKTMTGNIDAGPIGHHTEEEILQQERRRAIAEGKKPMLHSFDLNFLPSDDE